ncbi:MAG: hypothetical protein F6K36_05685 [Symploca sp. SIO3C6]|nr:hypothetical protein [Symploca sp. SIO3C6]
MVQWDFLIQKEGESSWQPIKSPKIDIEVGKYRVVAQSSLINIDVEVRLSHESLEEVPPKRRFQKRLRRTSREGLVVIMPFTYLKSGLWELSCSGDIMLDAISDSSRQAVKLQVLPIASETIPNKEVKSPQDQLISSGRLEANTEEEEEVGSPDEKILSSSSIKEGYFPYTLNPTPTPHTLFQVSEELVDTGNEDNKVFAPTPSTQKLSDSIPPSPQPQTVEAANLDENPATLTSESAEVGTSENPLMAQSLETLEQMMKQVVEPVLQEFEESEFHNLQLLSPKSVKSVKSESEADLETLTLIDQQGFTLSLDDEALVAKRGESLRITGKIDLPEVNSDTELDDRQFSSAILSYQLSNPQTSKVLVNVDKPVSLDSLPLAFSQTLEIPAECHTRLILGKVTLYSSDSVALASRAFSVTADLDELLGTIIPESQGMPVAKILGFANNPESWQTQGATPLIQISAPTPVDEALLRLVNDPQDHKPLPLQISSKQVLPPQLYPKNHTQRLSKSLQLPNFPKLQSLSSAEMTNPDSVLEEVEENQEKLAVEISDVELIQTSAGDKSPEIESPEEVIDSLSTTLPEDIFPLVEIVSSEINIDKPEALVKVADAEHDTGHKHENAVPIDWENSEQIPIPSSSNDTEAKTKSQPQSEPNTVDQILGETQIEERFWLRLNSLATDAQSSQWVTSFSSTSSNQVEVTQELNYEVVIEPEQSLDSEQSLGEDTGDFTSENTTETEQLQPLPLLENIPREVIVPEPTLSDSTVNKDWLAQEIVVEDEQLSESQLSSVRGNALEMIAIVEQVSTQSADESVSPLQLESPIPEPKIFIPTGELTAGESFIVRIKVPAYPSRLYVKLWVQDRQSRSLLDGPRSLMDFLPDDSGELEAMTQLTVPYGSLEIRLEAIAIDIYTQRESHKVGVERAVVHPNLSGGESADKFEL